jgi:hypothetical protein
VTPGIARSRFTTKVATLAIFRQHESDRFLRAAQRLDRGLLSDRVGFEVE